MIVKISLNISRQPSLHRLEQRRPASLLFELFDATAIRHPITLGLGQKQTTTRLALRPTGRDAPTADKLTSIHITVSALSRAIHPSYSRLFTV